MISLRDTCQIPNAHTSSRPISVSSVTLGENSDQILLMRSLTIRLCWLASRKRVASRFSCANALTTRMPGIVSASTLLTSDHTRSIFSKPVRSLSRTICIIQAMNGNGSKVISASLALMEIKIAAVMIIISTSVAKSNRCKDRNTQMRSDSEPILDIKSPVRLPPKYSNESFSRCS